MHPQHPLEIVGKLSTGQRKIRGRLTKVEQQQSLHSSEIKDLQDKWHTAKQIGQAAAVLLLVAANVGRDATIEVLKAFLSVAK
jgi:hypothetical protein